MNRDSSFSTYFCLHRKFLIYNLIARSLKVRYRKSFFGMIWTVLIPAGSALVYYVIFSHVLKVNIQNHLLFILAGLIPWTFFSTTLTAGLESIVGNMQLLSKVPMPLQSLPLTETATNFLNLLFSLPVILVMMAIARIAPTWAFFQLPVLFFLLFMVSYGLCMLLALTYAYFRDLKYLMNIVIQFWFYLTPIMYTPDMIPERYRFALYINPVGIIFAGIGTAITQGRWLTPEEWLGAVTWAAALVFGSKFLLSQLHDSIVEIL